MVINGYCDGITFLLHSNRFKYAERLKTENEAREFIKLFKEQQLKEDIKIIDVEWDGLVRQ